MSINALNRLVCLITDVRVERALCTPHSHTQQDENNEFTCEHETYEMQLKFVWTL